MQYWLRGFYNITLIDFKYDNLLEAQAKKQALEEDAMMGNPRIMPLYCSLEIVQLYAGTVLPLEDV